MPNIPPFPENCLSVHPFKGGEDFSYARLVHSLKSEIMVNYKGTRNGLMGIDYSTKLSAFLAQGCITARQIHAEMAKYEDGKDDTYKYSKGYGEGENDGTRAVRSGMLWRDYMRQWMQKIGPSIFCLEGYNKHKRGHNDPGKQKPQWKTTSEDKASPDQDPKPQEVAKILERLYAGTTGMGLIDASQRELIHTGYTSNRARQNVVSFLAKHLGIDWRYGAEWYEMLLVDYDVSSNWANWQYFASVGNGRRDRIFNPVKQAFDYDKEGTYVKTWVPELRGLRKPENIFQAWTASTSHQSSRRS